MKKLVVADLARADLKEIAAATENRWGAEQRRTYLEAIASRLAQLREHPSLGASRSELGTDLRSIQSGRHVIFYRDGADSIEIIRVLHERMDVRHHLSGRTGSSSRSGGTEPRFKR